MWTDRDVGSARHRSVLRRVCQRPREEAAVGRAETSNTVMKHEQVSARSNCRAQ